MQFINYSIFRPMQELRLEIIRELDDLSLYQVHDNHAQSKDPWLHHVCMVQVVFQVGFLIDLDLTYFSHLILPFSDYHEFLRIITIFGEHRATPRTFR